MALSSFADCRSWPNGFLDHHPTPEVVTVLCQTHPVDLLKHRRKRLRRNRQVERVIAVGAAFGIQELQGVLEVVERGVVVE